jgi:radical SAM superfamily enzyme YgiQ (UPF0313 family)
MVRVAIVAVAVERSAESLPLGAASIVAALRAGLPGRLDAFILEGAEGGKAAELSAAVMKSGADWAGFSVYSWNRDIALEAARRLRTERPGMLLFAGGPEATADPSGVLAQGSLDFVLAGEGESATVAVLSKLLDSASPREGLAGIGAVAGMETAASASLGRRAPIEDPARLPSPWLAAPPLRRGAGGPVLDPSAYEGLVWELARGCPFRCAYCYESKGESGVRRFPMERIEAELELFVRAKATQVFVLDPTFNADKDRAARLLALFAKRAPGIRWKFEARAELLDRRLARAFAGIDCSLQIGLQSVRPEVLEAIGRRIDREDFSRKVGLLNAEGLSFGLDLIYGLPLDSLSGFRESLDFAVSLLPNHLDIFRLSVLPGTELADRAAEFGLVADAKAPYLVRSSPGFPAEALERARLLAEACDLFYSRGRAVAWFLTAIKPLRLRPSAFFADFSAWKNVGEQGAKAAADAEASSAEIEGLQLGFLEERYRAKGLEALLPALADLVRFHGAWGRALAEGQRTKIDFTYDPDEVLGPGALDLAQFVRRARPRPASVVVAPGKDGGVAVERGFKAGRRL